MTVADAAELVAFTPLVPAELGEPDAVEVSADRVIVSMSWTTDEGPVRLDQFDGRLDFRIAKTSPTSSTPPSATPTPCGSRSRTRW